VTFLYTAQRASNNTARTYVIFEYKMSLILRSRQRLLFEYLYFYTVFCAASALLRSRSTLSLSHHAGCPITQGGDSLYLHCH
jgi:hypothetical protein